MADHVRGEPRPFSADDFHLLFATRNNWGRWGDDDQRGTINLIDEAKRREAAGLVRSGRLVSLCRPFPKDVASNNPRPAQQYLVKIGQDALEFLGVYYHGVSTTHLDALCHMWAEHGMYNGRDPEKEFTTQGFTWGDVEQWGEGIITRGILFDIPKLRGLDCVEHGEPVQGWELEKISIEQNIEVRPGDAIVVHCGREAWTEKHGEPWGGGPNLGKPGPRDPRPGLGPSCLEFIRDTDCGMLVWDMLDALPNGIDLIHSVHASIYMFGLALIDNALIAPLAAACEEEDRHDFMLTIAPLRVHGGTGSPVNPLAMF